MSDALVVFTVEGIDTILNQRGSQFWKLNRARAKESKFVVFVQNRSKSESQSQHGDWDFATATESHGTAFLVARIAEIERPADPKEKHRWFIRISEYAKINIPEVWEGWRFPVRYMRLADLGIDPSRLQFTPVLLTNGNGKNGKTRIARTSNIVPLTITEAKRGLSARYDIEEDAIEITMRG
jgi:hypothetical protein